MKYIYKNMSIPNEKRKEYNEKLLSVIQLNLTTEYGISNEDIFNAYTGNGGLHGLNFNDYTSYAAYSKEKKEIELGQFFTPPPLCELITSLFPIKHTDTCADLSFGMGNFFNSLPNEGLVYGTEIDTNAYNVAKRLYPTANLENVDLRMYEAPVRFDYIFGNPPFNLRWNIKGVEVASQNYFCEKSYDSLKPLGVLAMIIPDSWLKDTHFYSGFIQKLNKQFGFLCQFAIPPTHKQYGWNGFPVKVIILHKASEYVESKPYSNEYVSYEEAQNIVNAFIVTKNQLRAKTQGDKDKEQIEFEYKVKKYLYEIHTHKVLKSHYASAIAYVDKLTNQSCPQWILDIKDYSEREKEWDKIRVTKNRVIAYLKRILRLQDKPNIEKTEWVKTNYGIKLKAYSTKEQARINAIKSPKFYSWNSLIINENECLVLTKFRRVYNRRLRQFKQLSQSFKEMGRDNKVDAYLSTFTFNSTENSYHFAPLQHNDTGLILQKPYGALNWSPGCGKTAAGYAVTKYRNRTNTFIIAPAVAIELTWSDFLTQQKEAFINIRNLSDVYKIRRGLYVIMSTEMLVKYKKFIRKYIKIVGKNVMLLLDESDEMTNRESKRSLSIFDCFKDVKYKLLTTGTLTRNNIGELYAQMELLYNNSVNMLCRCEFVYEEKRDLEGKKYVSEKPNTYYMQPFSAYRGMRLFNSCFNPSKASVFGVKKQNQDIHNESSLRGLIEQMVITRSFKEIAGDKYEVSSITIRQNNEERNIYRKVLNDFHEIRSKKHEDARKDSMLAIIQQLEMLIKCTSMPHLIKGSNVHTPTKANEILRLIGINNEKITVGCISLNAVSEYRRWISEKYPHRQIFVITGSVDMKIREKLIADFQATENGILICTQQSLRASVNIPTCNLVLLESKQWNIPKMEQFYFRFIRYNSKEFTRVYIISYTDTIEMNLLALLMAKEKINDYIKTLSLKMNNDIYEEFGIDLDILESILEKVKDKHGKVTWGNQSIE